MNEFLTLDEVAEMLRVSKPTVKRAVREQGLPALKLGDRVWRFKRADVEAWVERTKGAA